MGAQFDYRIYDCDTKQDIQKSWIKDQKEAIEEYVEDHMEEYDDSYEDAMDNIGYSGDINTLPEKIEWVRVIPFDNERDAVDYISKNHEKWENPLGVPFMSYEDIHYAVGGWCSI
ncbi:MAG: hypothetical protein EBU90_26975 [Proteobacteria bacterium]|nr:hypothetical protein [Pseudomonadota bacterium]